MSLYLLAAGGTGGHLFPAEALAHELIGRGHTVHLATDERVERYSGSFPAERIHTVPSATFGSRNPIAVARAGWTLFRGMRATRRLLREIRPAAVVGFGGYPTIPPMLVAASGGFPAMIHEANGVMGRANKLLAPRVTAIAGGFLKVEGPYASKMTRTGNPVRPAVLEAAKEPYAPGGEGQPFRLLVFGGSQGASFFGEAVPDAVANLPAELRNRLRIVQQSRPEDESAIRERYAELDVEVEVAPFFSDLPSRIASAHLVVSRSGASTVSEVATIGRPAILVPLPHALDQDQAVNAAGFEAEGGAILAPQSELTGSRLGDMLEAAMREPDRLAQMAASAKTVGHADAARRLADLAESIARKGD